MADEDKGGGAVTTDQAASRTGRTVPANNAGRSAVAESPSKPGAQETADAAQSEDRATVMLRIKEGVEKAYSVSMNPNVNKILEQVIADLNKI
jgi:hypothetical protein